MKIVASNQNSFLPVNNASPLVIRNRNLWDGQSVKDSFQDYLCSFQFGSFITVEPTPYSPMNDDDIEQRIREVDMLINRELIGNKFSKFKYKRDRFWLMGFFEDGHDGRSYRHTHLLHYIPYHQFTDSMSQLRQRVIQLFKTFWYSIPYVTRRTQQLRDPYPVDIRELESVSSSRDRSIYASKKVFTRDRFGEPTELDNCFFSY